MIQIPKKKTKTKYGVDITEAGVKARQCADYITGEILTFDSRLEKQYYEEVIINGVKNGTIVKYKLQQPYKLQSSFKYKGKTIREINYVSDFIVWYKDGSFQVIDVKGRPTSDAKIKKKMYHYVYPDIDFIWVSHTKETGWLEYGELEKHRKNKKNLKEKLNVK